MSSVASPRALLIGVHVLDVLVRPVESIPEGQGATLVEQIGMSPAGTAGAAAVVLSRLGARARCAGTIGDDAMGELLRSLLEREGVDTSLLVRLDGVATSASVLPIRADGSRPALHQVGANQFLGANIPWDSLSDNDIVHIGAPEFYGGDVAADVARRARAGGAITSADSLGPGAPGVLDYIAAALPHLDFLLPNDEQAMGWTDTATVTEAATTLVAMGVSCVAVTCGARPTVVATADGVTEVPTYPVDVVDTSGCGDAFSAGFLRGITLGLSPVDAAQIGNATAAQVAGGLGSAHGAYDLAAVRDLVGTTS